MCTFNTIVQEVKWQKGPKKKNNSNSEALNPDFFVNIRYGNNKMKNRKTISLLLKKITILSCQTVIFYAR